MVPSRLGVTVIVVSALLWATAASAQQTSGITGVVKDTSGAVLPGVTVEASSPALIEKTRSVTSDGDGRFNIVDLQPGTYTVTFSLAGFTTFKRDGVAIPAGFTATVDGELRVGALEESVTVTGAAPLVDTQNVRKQLVASAELLSALPTSSKHINTMVTLTPGYTGVTDVGGAYTAEAGSFHGKRGTKVSFNGMGVENSSGNSSYQLNAATVEEIVLQTSGISAEVNADGPVMNVVPKTGGNTFSTILNGLYSNHSMEGDNLTPDLQARGLTTANKRVKIFDESASLGGPIKKDKLWFFGAFRTWGSAKQYAGVYWNQTQDQSLTPPGAILRVVPYTPWVDRPLDVHSARWESYDSEAGRLTWQAGAKHKIDFFIDHQIGCNCGSNSAANTVETLVGSYKFEPNRFIQATYNAPLTEHLLLEAGYGASISQWNETWQPGVTPEVASVTDIGLGVTYGSATTYRGRPDFTNRTTQRFSATYVTGAHNFKAGIQTEQLLTDQFIFTNANMNYTFRNGAPVSITQYTTPYRELDGGRDLGIYAQDQWKIKRASVTMGLRFDRFQGYTPAQNLPGSPDSLFDQSYPGVRTATTFANQWLGPRSFPEVDNIPNWKDFDPRLGVSYDLFGNGRTALKASIGRYVAKTNVDVSQLLNPINTSVNSATRSWTDLNNNLVPDCDLGNFGKNGECGPLSNQYFGQTNPSAISWSDAVRTGWGARDFNWDTSVEIQHELRQGLSLTGGYYRNTGGYYRNTDSKNRVTDNVLVSPSDYSPYCVTAPADPRLPGGGGYQICGMSDINANKFGQVQQVVQPTSMFGKNTRYNDFFSIGIDSRFAHGARLGGGFDTGRSVDDTCFVVDNPGFYGGAGGFRSFASLTFGPETSTTINGQQVCRIVIPFKGQTQVKLNGSLPLIAGFVVAGVYQDMSGPPIEATWAAPNAAIAPSLGRNLAGGALTANVPLIAPYTQFEGRIRRLDLRLSKYFKLSPRMGFQANLDAYNALNSSAIQSLNTTFGKNWLSPTTILDPRLLQVSGQFTF